MGDDYPNIKKKSMEKIVIKPDVEELEEEERKRVGRLGINNIDYSILSILKERFPELDFDYDEDEGKLIISNGDETIEHFFDKEFFLDMYEGDSEVSLKESVSQRIIILEGIIQAEFDIGRNK